MLITVFLTALVVGQFLNETAIDSKYKLYSVPRCNQLFTLRKQNIEVRRLVEKLVDEFLVDDYAEFSISDFSFADKEIQSFCQKEVENDYECFNVSTSRGQYQSLLQVWDLNQDKKVS